MHKGKTRPIHSCSGQPVANQTTWLNTYQRLLTSFRSTSNSAYYKDRTERYGTAASSAARRGPISIPLYHTRTATDIQPVQRGLQKVPNKKKTKSIWNLKCSKSVLLIDKVLHIFDDETNLWPYSFCFAAFLIWIFSTFSCIFISLSSVFIELLSYEQTLKYSQAPFCLLITETSSENNTFCFVLPYCTSHPSYKERSIF